MIRFSEIIEGILVKIDKFIFLVDFIMLDVIDDFEIPIILSRPFLPTSKALIDISGGMIVLRASDEEAVFGLPKDMRHSLDNDDTCYSIDTIDVIVSEHVQEIIYSNTWSNVL